MSVDSTPLSNSSEILLSGELTKWTNWIKGWQPRWFQFSSNGELIYDKSAIELQIPKQRRILTVRFCNLVLNIDESSAAGEFILYEREPNDKNCIYYLRADTKNSYDLWIDSLTSAGCDILSGLKFRLQNFFGELVPQLSFPNFDDERELLEIKERNTEILKRIIGIGFEAAGAAAGFFIPGGHIALKILQKGIPKLLSYLSGQIDHIMSSPIDIIIAEINENQFHFELSLIRAKFHTIMERYEKMIEPNATSEQIQNEVPTVMSNCSEVLYIFNSKDRMVYKNPLYVIPVIVNFAYAYVSIMKICSLYAPNYESEILLKLKALLDCLQDFKIRGIAQRLGAVTQSSTPKTIYFQIIDGINSFSPVFHLLRLTIWSDRNLKVTNNLPEEAVIDKMYAKNGRGTRKQYVFKFENPDVIFKYKTNLENLYVSYFAEIEQEIINFLRNMN